MPRNIPDEPGKLACNGHDHLHGLLPRCHQPSEFRAKTYLSFPGDRFDVIRNVSITVSLLIRRLESYFAQHGLSQLRFLFLIVIDREPGRDTLTVGEITARLDVAGPIVARTLRALETEGLLVVTRDDLDARTKHVGLTDRGSALLAQLLPGYFAIIAEEMEATE